MTKSRPPFQKKLGKSHFSLRDIRIAPQNLDIYEPCGIDNDDDRALLESIRANGIEEPLVLTEDRFLISGNRRYWAAKRLGLKAVPVRFIKENFELLSRQDRLSLLRRFNQQREKSNFEKLRETSLDIDPKEAYSKLLKRRVERTLRSYKDKGNITLGHKQRRKRITTLEYLAAVKKVVFDNEEYWPLTDRRVHYLLLNDPPLMHDKKPHSRYQNTTACYNTLTNLITRARLSGEIPMHAIEDPTRPVCEAGGFSNFQQFFKQETENFLYGYHRNLMQGQEAHVEILLEKAALRSVVERVASEYCITVTTTRGYPSLTPRYELVQRFRRSGKRSLVLLILADFDPDGEEIAASIARSLRDDFGISEWSMRAIKVGLTHEDILTNDFPSELEAKRTSPNYAKFIEKFGERVVELDAAPVEWIQEKLSAAIQDELDMDEYFAQIKLEQQDSVEVETHRRLILQNLLSHKTNEEGKSE